MRKLTDKVYLTFTHKMAFGSRLCFALCLYFAPNLAYCASLREQKIKSAIAFSIVKFIEWPSVDNSPKTSLRICTLEDAELNASIKEIFDGKVINNLPVNYLEISDLQITKKNNCDIVFIGSDVRERNSAAISGIPGAVLSICEVDVVEWNGCIAQIFPSDNRAKIAFDLKRASHAGLRIGSELLAVAIVRK